MDREDSALAFVSYRTDLSIAFSTRIITPNPMTCFAALIAAMTDFPIRDLSILSHSSQRTLSLFQDN